MEEEKKAKTDKQIAALAAKVAERVAKDIETKDDAMKVLEVAKTLLSMRLKD